jgi:hypothetical protein
MSWSHQDGDFVVVVACGDINFNLSEFLMVVAMAKPLDDAANVGVLSTRRTDIGIDARFSYL